MNKTFRVNHIKLALLAVEPKMTLKQRQMLAAHYYHRTLSTGKIAKLVGYSSYRIVNMQYGTLCRRIADELGYKPPYDKIFTIATVSSKRDELGHAQWRLDAVVAKALEGLGWVKKRPA
ncbi:MAG TPA: hypothetical protein VGG62_11305 [Terracidiphilus sp.]|jgi:hypothetical protein